MSLNKPHCRWLIGTVFFLSLAANLFLAGYMFGDGGAGRARPPGGMFFDAFNRKVEALPEPDRTKVKEVLAQYTPEMKKQMKRVMKQRASVDALIQSKGYNRADAETAFVKLQDESLIGQQLGQEMMLDIADALSPEQRAHFLERSKEFRGRGAEFKSKTPPQR